MTASAADITVNSAADVGSVGVCTLRDAIIAANTNAAVNGCVAGQASPTQDVIRFNIPAGSDPNCVVATGVCTLRPATSLPVISETVSLAGYNQPTASVNTQPAAAYPNILGIDSNIRIEIDGTNAGAGAHGLNFSAGAANSSVRGLSVVNFTGGAGVMILGNGIIIDGNYLGVRANGSSAGGNMYGAYVNGVTGTRIGDTSASARNLIASNSTDIMVAGGSTTDIVGNLIGTDRSGTTSLASGTGIRISSNAAGRSINRNLISGHTLNGIYIDGGSQFGIYDNAIGIGAGGVALGAGGAGVLVTSASLGAAPQDISIESNGIAHHTQEGILVTQHPDNGSPTGIKINGNAIYANGYLGINLKRTGEAANIVTANDNQDPDSGPNRQQNRPVITSAAMNGSGGVDIVYTFNSLPSTAFQIRAYASDNCPTGTGVGRYPSGSLMSIGTNAAGDYNASWPVPAGQPGWTGGGQWLTLLARETATGNTSEFSDCVQITGAPAQPTISINDVSVNEGNSGTTNFSFTVSLSAAPSAPVSVTWATANGTATAGTDYASGTSTLNWGTGDASTRTVTVVVNGDSAPEANEAFTVTLSSPSGATLADASGTGTIVNDDGAPVGVAPAITSGSLVDGAVGAFYSFTVTATGTPTPSFAATGLPVGMSINLSSGVISGTPSTAGNFPVVITASNGVLPNATQSVSLTILAAPPQRAGGSTPIPVLSPLGLVLLSGLIAVFGLWRRKAQT